MKPGLLNRIAVRSLMPVAWSWMPVEALIASGTDITFSERRWAVTTISSRPPELASPAACGVAVAPPACACAVAETASAPVAKSNRI